VALGATLFNYGNENDFGGIWFNLEPGGWKFPTYYQVAQLYGGSPATPAGPVITDMSAPQTVSAGKQFAVSVAVPGAVRYNLMYTSKYVDGSTMLRYADFTQTGANSFNVTAPNQLGVWKVYVYAYDGHGNVAVETRSIKVTVPPVNGTNVALGKPTTASSYQQTGNGAPYPPSNAVDGNTGTRWATDWSDPQWIQVDLGQTTAIHHIQLVWEAAYGKAYTIQVSPDGSSNWTTIHSTTTGAGGVEDFDVSGSGRFVRLTGTQRGTTYGYSLYEFGVYQ
jgi:type II secretory pathway pseudopilin PulG